MVSFQISAGFEDTEYSVQTVLTARLLCHVLCQDKAEFINTEVFWLGHFCRQESEGGIGTTGYDQAMDWTEVRDELISAPPASPPTLSGIERPGVYAWWDPTGALTRFWPIGFPQVYPAEPLYIGIARTTLAERGGEMHLKNTRMSTIRRSLAALLVDELHLLPGAAVDLNPRNRTKFSLGPAAEQRLTSWMKTHLQVTWILHPTPGDFEKDIVKRLTPPLNHTYATKGPYAKPLQVHREKLLGRMAATMLFCSGTLRRRQGFRDSNQTAL